MCLNCVLYIIPLVIIDGWRLLPVAMVHNYCVQNNALALQPL